MWTFFAYNHFLIQQQNTLGLSEKQQWDPDSPHDMQAKNFLNKCVSGPAFFAWTVFFVESQDKALHWHCASNMLIAFKLKYFTSHKVLQSL
jgi:hypothetical protein